MFRPVVQGGHRLFRFDTLEQIPHFTHGVTCRQPDPAVSDDPLDTLAAFGVAIEDLVFLKQVHSNVTRILETSPLEPRAVGRGIGTADGVVCGTRGLLPVIRTADCVPVLAVVEDPPALGLFHAGWRGTCGHVISRGLSTLLAEYQVVPKHLHLAIGPCIRRCCYEVGPEVAQRFEEAGFRTDSLYSGRRLDLVQAVVQEASALGVVRFYDCGLCTSCRSDLFYSYRREGTPHRIWTFAGFRGQG